MRKLPRVAGIVLMSVLCMGLSTMFDILVIQEPSKPVCFKLQRVNPLTRIASDVELNNFAVVKRRDGVWDYKHPLWEFGMEPGHHEKISEFQYGVTPSGFIEKMKAEPLSVGVSYLAYAGGAGAGGETEFVAK